jgi:hypothetical protein
VYNLFFDNNNNPKFDSWLLLGLTGAAGAAFFMM